MERKRLVFAGFSGFLFLISLTYANWLYARAYPGGTDFLVHWVAARHVLMHGESPYTDRVALEIQRAIYGRPARPDEHQQRVVYPLYSILIFAPFALISDFTWARALWMTALEGAFVATLLLALRLSRWRPRVWMWGSLLLFTFTWYYGLRTLIHGNAVGLVALFLTLAAYMVEQKRDIIAGLAIALATIKPNLAILPFLFLLWWAWKQERFLLWMSAIGGWIFLALGATVLKPKWWIQYIVEVWRFPSYTPPGTIQALFAQTLSTWGRLLGLMLSLALGFGLLRVWQLAGQRVTSFVWAYWWTIAASQWVGIQTDPGNAVILLPALIYIWGQLMQQNSWGLGLVGISLVGLWLGPWALFLITVGEGSGYQTPWLLLPIPGYVFFGLGVIRLWTRRNCPSPKN